MLFRETNGGALLFFLNREIPVCCRGSSGPQFEPKSQLLSELHGRCQISDIFWLKNCRKLPASQGSVESARGTNLAVPPRQAKHFILGLLCRRAASAGAGVHPHAAQHRIRGCAESPMTKRGNRYSTRSR